jgi:hypothetical protein
VTTPLATTADVPSPDEAREPRSESRWQLFWSAVFTAHATGAALWWWLTPKGFALASPQFWANQVLPWLVLVAMIVGRWALGRGRTTSFVAIIGGLIMAWLTGVIGAADVYPVSFGYRALLLLIVPLAMYAALGRTSKPTALPRRPRLATIGGLICGALVGAWFAISQQAPPADTRPLNVLLSVPVVSADDGANADVRSIRLGNVAQVQPADALVNVFAGRRMIGVQPVLTFISRSPDRCWTLFAPRALRNGPPRRLLSCTRPSDDAVELALRDDCDSTVRVARSPNSLIDIDSSATLRGRSTHTSTPSPS